MAAAQLRNLIFYHVDNEMLDTANFLAGRLHALEPRSADSAHLLALTYYRLRRFKAAYDSAHKYGANGRHLGCAFVLAQASLPLKRYVEGMAALEKARPQWQGKSNLGKHTETTRRHLPDAAAVLNLLGRLYQAHGDFKRAGECYVEVHKANPFVWEAFEGLCKIGSDLNISNMFTHLPETATGKQSIAHGEPVTSLETIGQSHAHANISNHTNVLTPLHDPFNVGTTLGDQLGNFMIAPVKDRLRNHQHSLDWDTPTASSGIVLSDEDAMNMEQEREATEGPSLTARRPRHLQESSSGDFPIHADPALRKAPSHSLKRTISGHIPQPVPVSTSADAQGNPRRSNRLFGQGTTTKSSRPAVESTISVPSRLEREARPARTATGARGRAANVVGRVVSGNRKVLPPDPAEKEKERLKRASNRSIDKGVPPTQPAQTGTAITKPQVAIQATSTSDPAALGQVLDGLKRLAVSEYALSRFDLPLAIQHLRSLPAVQKETPWVLAQLGKAYYETNDYRAAEECFARLMKLQPSRIEDMEVYSTVLWHLKKETALALLCHTLREQHYEEPQTWCVIGNAFSLANEHDQAISAFRRATQLDEKFAYAWTLMGHEYISNEEYDAALFAFRKSIAADRRGFGGWYGLGKSLEKIGKYEAAERHFRIAASINPSNTTLLVCIGVVLEKLHNRKAASAQYSQALSITPSSALARFKRARVLLHMRQFDDALSDLEILRDQAPDEANVWFLLGKCYKSLGDRGDALKAFTTALNLDAKASPFIREAMDALDEDYEDEVDSDGDAVL